MTEIELKFGVPEVAQTAIDRRLRQLGARAQTLESHYWDSADRRLARAGLSLRLRKAAGRWEQTLKAAGPSPAERLEETVSRPGRWEAGGPSPELWMFAGSAAFRRADAALAGETPAAPLQRVHSSLVTRLATRVDVHGADLEIAFDRGAIVAGTRSSVVCELEIELKHGDMAALLTVARAGIDAFGLWLCTISKAERGDRLAADEMTKAVPARPPALRKEAEARRPFAASPAAVSTRSSPTPACSLRRPSPTTTSCINCGSDCDGCALPGESSANGRPGSTPAGRARRARSFVPSAATATSARSRGHGEGADRRGLAAAAACPASS